MSGCTLCPRACGADREAGQRGFCRADRKIRVARAALHFWEEPCLSGKKGSGAVFFSGCALGCVFCQNAEISLGEAGEEISPERLSDIFLELQQQGANNINLVTAEHYLPEAAKAICRAKEKGLRLPVIWNSSGYELPESLRQLEGLVDIYLPDFKYFNPETAKRYSHAEDYPAVAKEALEEMVRQQPDAVLDQNGMMTSGVIVRHLLLPGHVREAEQILQYLHDTYGDEIYISIMNQYTPMPAGKAADPLLGRKVTKREYERLLAFASEIGIQQGYYQEGDTAAESFIPAFDGSGVIAGK